MLWAWPVLLADLRILALFRICRLVHVLTTSGHLVYWPATVPFGHRTLLLRVVRICRGRLRFDKFERVWVYGLLTCDLFMLFKCIHDFSKVLGHQDKSALI